MNQRLQAIIERAYTLSAQVLNGDKPDLALAEELSGETAELLTLLVGDSSAFESDEVMDTELVQLAQVVPMLDRVTTLIYNTEGDVYQQAYEKLEEVISQLQTQGETK